ncbi:MAG: putative ATP-dependent helicase DinG [Firmicutes bacterium]|nr:putative ATP-dependent helicase DinG [candidate division NPL-UPA2 bacterium]
MRIEDIFGTGGPIAKHHPTYETRRQQVSMANAVASSLSLNRHLVVQAGTGLGKTFGYLVPAIIHARTAKKRIVISTKTLNLQEQIFKKDIPFLQKVFSTRLPFVAVLAKGRSNFICRRKMEHIRTFDRGLLTQESHIKELREMQDLLGNKKFSGDREQLTFHPAPDLWQHVCGEGESCLRRVCPFFADCFYYMARRAQSQADIVVANHALFFADLAVRKDAGFLHEQAVLEDYDAVVFDEAHNLEDVATDFFSRRVSPGEIRRTTAAISAGLRGMLVSDNAESGRIVEALIQNVTHEAGFFFLQFSKAMRLMPGDKYPHVLKPHLVELIKALAELTAGANEEQTALAMQLCQRLTRIDETLDFILERRGGDEEYAYWVELGEEGVTLVSAPVSMEDELREHIFARISAVVLTSATLSSVLLRRVGLDKCDLLRLDSPFDYAKNALLYLPKDAKDPREETFDEYAAAKIAEIVRVTQGRALVLFTSFRSMQEAFERLAPLDREGFTVLMQGNASRSTLMHRFTTSSQAVLLAVASYWEGIDVPGEALSCVILVRLPFGVPTEPITQARIENMERKGEEAFSAYSLPTAILKLKQGFGRLIRTAEDKGVVAILDGRVQNKGYGRAFLKELPPARITHALDDVKELLAVRRR